MITVQCEGCGRVRDQGTEWRFDCTVKVDLIGYCGTCLTLQKNRQGREWRETGRRLLRARQRGYKRSSSSDPFKGFKEKKA